MSNNKELNQFLNNNFNKNKEEKKKKLLKEQEELINNYNKETTPFNDFNKITLNNFYNNYFNSINNIVFDLLYFRKWIHDGRMFYLGITFIFISLIYFIYFIINNYQLLLKNN